MMALGAEGVFVGSGIFKSEDPPTRARAIVEATTHWQDPARVAEASRGPRPADGQPRELQARRASSCWPSAAGSAARTPLVGVLALQGDFEAHERMLRALGAAHARGPRRRATSRASTGW